MGNTYVIVTYVAILTFAIGAGILWLCFVFEDINDRKHYKRLKDDAAFWQMKIEQSGMNIVEYYEDEKEKHKSDEWYDKQIEELDKEIERQEKEIDKLNEESKVQDWQYQKPEEGMKELKDWIDENEEADELKQELY